MDDLFNEIEVFFKQKQFSQEQLEEFIINVQDNCKGSDARKLVVSTIDMKLSCYKPSDNPLGGFFEMVKRNRIKRNKKKAAFSSAKQNLKKLSSEWLQQRVSKQNASGNRKKVIKLIKRTTKQRKTAPGVYGKLERTKSIRKIIYTRMS